MYLNEICIKNFRNIEKINIKFLKEKNIFIGKNAQGKTSILESTYFLAITKSHRTNIDSNLIRNGEKEAKVVGEIVNNEKEKDKLEISISDQGKKAKINGEKINKLSNYISKLGVVMFSPDDLEILKGSPSVRRKSLNISISQIYKEYLVYLNLYNNILKQRNEYLKKSKSKNFDELYFEVITEKIIQLNIKIIIYRKKFIDNINKNINKIYKKLLGEETIKIKYETIIKEEQVDDNIEEEIKKRFIKVRQAEMFQQTTLVGIHRDDFLIISEKGLVSEYFSQGLQKIAILALKLSELITYEEIKGETPIILLDDIFSELDNIKKNRILKYFNKDTQVFITTIDLKNINNKYFKDAMVYKIKEGKIKNATKEER